MLSISLAVVLLAMGAYELRGARRRRKLELHLAELHACARVEAPTMLRTRHAFTEDLELELRRAERTGRPAALVVLSIEPEHGQPASDDADRIELARAIRKAGRAIDIAYRLGTDEFALILPETRARGALVATRRLQAALHAAGAPAGSVSAGIAELGPGIDRHELFRNAYCALLAAGRQGNSRVLAYSPELEQAGADRGLEGLGEVEPVDGRAS